MRVKVYRWIRTYGGILPMVLLGLSTPASAGEFDAKAVPLLKRYCYECHGDGASAADLELDKYKTLAEVRQAKDVWGKVIRYARTQTMPPPDAELAMPQAEREELVDALMREVYEIDPKRPDPGPMVVRRLNRIEYRNTIRDLTGVTFDPTVDFPQDDTGYGFDNIGDVLTLPPMLVEKYLVAAERVVNMAVPTPGRGGAATRPAGGKMAGPMKSLFDRHGPKVAGDPRAERAAARGLLEEFVTRAWRRPVMRDEADRVLGLYDLARRNGEGFQDGVKHAMTAVLVSPSFLFRGEVVALGGKGGRVRPVGDFELASRLSYFLWSSMPDGELMDLARKGQLRGNLEPQVKRMLASPKAAAFAENFAGQWLQFRNLDAVHPDAKTFDEYDDRLREAMQRETQTFFASILKEDRSLMDVLTADYTFVNERLAKHYGLPDVKGNEFRRVSLSGTPRRGVMTHGSVLTLTSNPTRTSPVKRGKWVLESLLGTAPPPPPPDVPALETDGKKVAGTAREQLEKHREDPNCASCHAPMDPIGFGLENFNAIGAWREKDGASPIDATSEFAGGQKFTGPVELADLLAKTRKNDFYRAVAEAAMTFALGRGVEPHDMPAVDGIIARLKKEDGRFSALILGVVDSVPFQMRRGEAVSASAAAREGAIVDGGVATAKE